MNRVPVVRRSLLAEPRRLVASVVGVGLALMLVLLVTGLWSGIQAQVTAYEDHTGAQLYVVEPGTRTLFADSSSVPISRLAQVRETPGVSWAAPVRALYMIFQLHDKKAAVAVVGYDSGLQGGPTKLTSGRLPRAADEVVVDRALARTHGLHVGATFDIASMTFHVVGVQGGPGMFMTPLVFVPHATTDQLLQAPNTTSTILVGTTSPTAVAARLRAEGMTVVDTASLRAENLRLATKIYGVLIKVMVGVGFVAGTLIVALSAYSLVVERRREFGIIKAIGATQRRLVGFAIGETLILAASGFVVSLAMANAARWLITSARPQFAIVYTTSDLVRAGLVAFVMAFLAAVMPARRLNRLDPAVAYRSE
jgi:putative ABC transport system permease protein